MGTDNQISTDLEIIECTLRDGSYAINFRFTEEDTAIICRMLSQLGFKYIEIGHGFGINAANAGKGKMPSSDKKLLEVAKASVKDANIGMFCIPGIASLNDLKSMANAGLDFVRIGKDATEIEKTYPYIEVGRKYNLYTMVNFMKSYTISPREFAKSAKAAVKIGAEVIYLVDSAGGMLPEEIREYIEEAKSAVKVKLGLHAHNNLHLATANALEAIKSGAGFIDTTLYGLGRSAGNVPTEVMLAILENLGIDTGIDLFQLMDTADKCLLPLVSRVQMPSMLSVVMGASKFHSSFFPLVKKVAEEYDIDERRLVYAMGKKNPLSVDEKELRESAKKIGVHNQKAEAYDITLFDAPKIGRDYISNTFKSVVNLIDGLINACAKGRRNIVLEIVPATDYDDSLVLAEYITSDQEMVMGRIHFGSPHVLKNILGLVKKHVSLILIDISGKVDWIESNSIYSLAKEYFIPRQITFYNSRELQDYFVLENISALKNRINTSSLLFSGEDRHIGRLISRLAPIFEHIFIHKVGRQQNKEIECGNLPENCTLLEIPADWKNLNLKIMITLSLDLLSEDELENITRGMAEGSYFVITNHNQKIGRLKELPNLSVILLDYAFAYRGQFGRWMFSQGQY